MNDKDDHKGKREHHDRGEHRGQDRDR